MNRAERHDAVTTWRMGVSAARRLGDSVQFGPWQTVWKRHHKWSVDAHGPGAGRGASDADAGGLVDWKVSANSSMVRAPQHGTNTPRSPSSRREPRSRGDGGHEGNRRMPSPCSFRS